jgi:citrate synthase
MLTQDQTRPDQTAAAVQTSGPWWRERPLAAAEDALVRAVLAAHGATVARPEGLPCSTVMVLNAWHGSRNYAQAIAAGLMSLGEVHGPVPAAYGFLKLRAETRAARIASGKPIPGWGNDFVKGAPDPAWDAVEGLLVEGWPALATVLAETTEALQAAGKRIWPNAAGYTAAAAIAVGLPRAVCPWLFVAGRLANWSALLLAGGKENAEAQRRRDAEKEGKA